MRAGVVITLIKFMQRSFGKSHFSSDE